MWIRTGWSLSQNERKSYVARGTKSRARNDFLEKQTVPDVSQVEQKKYGICRSRDFHENYWCVLTCTPFSTQGARWKIKYNFFVKRFRWILYFFCPTWGTLDGFRLCGIILTGPRFLPRATYELNVDFRSGVRSTNFDWFGFLDPVHWWKTMPGNGFHQNTSLLTSRRRKISHFTPFVKRSPRPNPHTNTAP